MHEYSPILRLPPDQQLLDASDVDLRPQPYPSAFAADLPAGVRTVLRTAGVPGLAAFRGTARTRAERAAFRLTLAVSRFASFDVCHAHHTALVVPRAGDNFGYLRSTARFFTVLEGEVTLSAGGKTTRISAGGGGLVHGWDEYVYESKGAVSRVHVDIDAGDPAFDAALRTCPAMVWGAEAPLLRAAGVALTEVVRRDEGIDTAGRDGLARLVQSILLTVLASPPHGSVPAPVRQRLRARVLEHIAANHTDPGLSPATVATAVGISKRSLQRLFEHEAMGVAEHITAARLDHALALLREPRLAEMSIEEIAARTGFGSVARMRRVVRMSTAQSPTDFRKRHSQSA